MCQVLPQFYWDFNDKRLFLSVSVKEYKPYLLTKKYSFATHNDNFCPLKTCRYHIILISSSVKEILETIENLPYIYQTVDGLYTLYKHQFFASILEESGVVFAQLTRAVEHNLENKYVEKYPISPQNDWAKRRSSVTYYALSREMRVLKPLDHLF